MYNRVIFNLITDSVLNAATLKAEMEAKAAANLASGYKVPIAYSQVRPEGSWHVYGHVEFPGFSEADGFYRATESMWMSGPLSSLVNPKSKVILNDKPGAGIPDNKANK